MSLLRYTPRAEIDLVEIWRFSAERWDSEQADAYVGQILRTCERLADGTLVGRNADGIQPGLRSRPAGAHVVFYRESADEVLVLRVLHQRMDVPGHIDAE
jgi:toxin ParE1/3/4